MPSRRLSVAAAILLTAATLVGPSVSTAHAVSTAHLAPVVLPTQAGGNPATPGSFTGKAFDQCSAPSQRAMNAWRRHSPYRGVGIYISGGSRACHQHNLTPTWVSQQLAHGWKLLPIHVGRQAACNRHLNLHSHRISANPAHQYARARAQARAEANEAVRAARTLGLSRGSTIFYDLEAFSTSSATCRNSSLRFLSSWTQQLRASGYVSGVYSSASSGIKVLDRARWSGTPMTLPQQIWVADWNGRADTHSAYLHRGTWNDARVKQYRGSHTERHGGVAINIDSNYVDLRVSPGSAVSGQPKRAARHLVKHRTNASPGAHHRARPRKHATKHRAAHPTKHPAKHGAGHGAGHGAKPHARHHARHASQHAAKAKHATKRTRWTYLPGGSTPEVQNPVTDHLCTTRRLNLAVYLSTGVFRRESLHARLQCVLKQNGAYPHQVNGYWGRRTTYGVNKMQAGSGRLVRTSVTRGDWVSMLVKGHGRTWLKRGVRGADVVRLQRALHAAGVRGVYISGRYDRATARAVRTYQRRVGTRVTGTVGRITWLYLAKGRI